MVTCKVFIATSLDGYIAREDGSIDWLEQGDQSDAEDYGYAPFFDSIDALILGRTTFQTVMDFREWPYGDKPVWVVSRTLSPQSLPEEIHDRVRVTAANPVEVVRRLESEGARAAYVDGGRLIQAFLRAGLIHDITITRIPVILGAGVSLFGPVEDDIRLAHIETFTYPSGYVQSHYRVCRGA